MSLLRIIRAPLLMMMLLVSCTATRAPAQTTHGYLFVAPGHSPGGYTEHVGLGGEIGLPKRFGVGLDVGLHAQAKGIAHVRGLVLLLSLDGYYHLLSPEAETNWDPFAVAGATLVEGFLARTKVLNVGAGANYWFARHLGFRTEFRDYVRTGGGSSTAHIWEVRFALVIH